MKFVRAWARQESSCRRLEDGLHGLCQIAFAGVKLASLEIIPPAAKRMIMRILSCPIHGPVSG